jgi:flagellar biosynthesis/type III secretory pathway chaperone
MENSCPKNKIPIIIRWMTDQQGKEQVVVTLVDAEDYIETDGELLRKEVDNILNEYKHLMEHVSVEKLKIASKQKKLKSYWSLCKKLSQFNQKITSIFQVQNLKDAYEHDLGLSNRYVRDCINFAKSFKQSDVVDGVQLAYYSALSERANSLIKKGHFQDEIKYLIDSVKTNTVPSRDKYRLRLNDLVRNR